MDYQELGRAPATTLKGIPHAEKFSLGWWIVDLPHQYLKACNKHLPYMWVKFAIKNNHSQVCAPTPGIPLGKLGEKGTFTYCSSCGYHWSVTGWSNADPKPMEMTQNIDKRMASDRTSDHFCEAIDTSETIIWLSHHRIWYPQFFSLFNGHKARHPFMIPSKPPFC